MSEDLVTKQDFSLRGALRFILVVEAVIAIGAVVMVAIPFALTYVLGEWLQHRLEFRIGIGIQSAISAAFCMFGLSQFYLRDRRGLLKEHHEAVLIRLRFVALSLIHI